jgi:uncharacterized glyoxalase superfamily protein PhnB
MATEFAQVDVIASDVGATVEFYRRLGVDVPQEAVWMHGGEPHHVEVKMPNGAAIGIDSRTLTKSYDTVWPDQSGTILIFTVPDRKTVDELYAKMTAAGAVGHMEPIDVFWGSRYAIVDDPDGNHVGIMSPQDREHESVPGFIG